MSQQQKINELNNNIEKIENELNEIKLISENDKTEKNKIIEKNKELSDKIKFI